MATINDRCSPTLAQDDMFVAPVYRSSDTTVTPRKSNVYSHFSWAAGGFLIGAVCWHLVGFWGFVETVLLEDRAAIVASQQQIGEQGPVTHKINARLEGQGRDCVQVVNTAGAHETVVQPCVKPVVAMQADISALGVVESALDQ